MLATTNPREDDYMLASANIVASCVDLPLHFTGKHAFSSLTDKYSAPSRSSLTALHLCGLLAGKLMLSGLTGVLWVVRWLHATGDGRAPQRCIIPRIYRTR